MFSKLKSRELHEASSQMFNQLPSFKLKKEVKHRHLRKQNAHLSYWPTCPQMQKMTTVTSSAIPSSFLICFMKITSIRNQKYGLGRITVLSGRIQQTSGPDLCNLLTTKGTSMTSVHHGKQALQKIKSVTFHSREVQVNTRCLDISSLGRKDILGQYPGSRINISQFPLCY